MGPRNQPDFINAVACLDTKGDAMALLDELQGIEAAHGRRREGVRWGPRPLDLDLLLFGTMQIDNSRLTVPHPGLAERHFVLYPLADVASRDLRIPGFGTLGSLLARVNSDGLELV